MRIGHGVAALGRAPPRRNPAGRSTLARGVPTSALRRAGAGRELKRCDARSRFRQRLPRRRGSITERKLMYIGLGTILIIVVLFLLFREMSGRRA